VSYTYDANGNQTGASTGRAYTYNVFDQTVSLTPPLGGTVQNATYLGPNQDEIVTRGSDQYASNVLGIGVKVYSDATVSYFTRDETGALLSERAPGGARYYYVPDGLGSTIATTATGGAIANSYKYDPYGGVVTESETSVRPTSFRYAGGLYSSSVALHKFGQRWYDQSLDRWTQQDSIDQTGDLKQGNRYIYVGDNPVNGRDPSGLCTAGFFTKCDETPSCGGLKQCYPPECEEYYSGNNAENDRCAKARNGELWPRDPIGAITGCVTGAAAGVGASVSPPSLAVAVGSAGIESGIFGAVGCAVGAAAGGG
jgi:RHS repeat-associated protein